MYRQRFSLFSIGVALCGALVAAVPQQMARAAEPETRSITFALWIPADFGDELYLLDEDTVGLHFGRDFGATGTSTFASDSPPCEDLPVADTSWLARSTPMTILHKGGPIRGVRVYSFASDVPPPEHSLLRVDEITDVRACWIKENGSSQFYVQDEFDGYTVAAFYIVTGSFRVEN